MYFANTSSSTDLILYKGLLDKYLEEKSNEKISKLFTEIILSTHKLVKGEIKESEVDHKVFNLVIELSDHGKFHTRNYFEHINPNSIGIDQFRTLSNILNSLISEGDNDGN